ncbi:PIPO, partial [Peru tomato mosaic virus]|uniref:PIPO n=1 Tax=Peru tomato mosaic virus TaxID=187978 RepID=UPI0002651312
KLQQPFRGAVARARLVGKVIINLAIKKVKSKTSKVSSGRKSARFQRNFVFLSDCILHRGISAHKKMGFKI